MAIGAGKPAQEKVESTGEGSLAGKLAYRRANPARYVRFLLSVKRPTRTLLNVMLGDGLACLVLVAPSFGQSSLATETQTRIRVQVNLVDVVCSVRDRSGQPITTLAKEDFEVYEDGQKQEIAVFERETLVPLDLALMVDASLSTYKELTFERASAARFAANVIRGRDRMALYQFADAVTELAGFTGQIAALQDAALRIAPEAGTALYDAILLGSQVLARQPPERRRVIVLVTDAGETTSTSTFDQARMEVGKAGAMIYTILIRPVKNESGRNTAGEHALITMTEYAGGRMFFPDSYEDLDRIFSEISRDLHTQYRLAYYPPKKGGPALREIEVRVHPERVHRERVPGDYLLTYRRRYSSGDGLP